MNQTVLRKTVRQRRDMGVFQTGNSDARWRCKCYSQQLNAECKVQSSAMKSVLDIDCRSFL